MIKGSNVKGTTSAGLNSFPNLLGEKATHAIATADYPPASNSGKYVEVTTGSEGYMSSVGFYKYPAGMYRCDGIKWYNRLLFLSRVIMLCP